MLLEFPKHCREINKKKAEIKDAEVIMTMGMVDSLYILWLNKTGAIKPKKLFWWAFFIHTQKAQKVMAILLKFLDFDNVNYVVFSNCEVKLYSQLFKIPDKRFRYLPYGNWNPEIGKQEPKKIEELKEEYFFAGGYSNRDYISLINAWEGIPYKLVIIASRNNRDLFDYKQSGNAKGNLKILFDVESEVFDECLKGALACILPLRSNTGASGQSVALRCMRLGKLMISTRTNIMEEYIEDRKSGYLVDDLKAELPGIIGQVVNDSDKTDKMVNRSTDIYESMFAYHVITEKLKEILAG